MHDRLALLANVDQRHLRADGDDPALDEFALLEALGLDRSFEHRGKVFRLITHSTLLVMIGLRPPALIPSCAHERTTSDSTSRIKSQEGRAQSTTGSNRAVPAPHSV